MDFTTFWMNFTRFRMNFTTFWMNFTTFWMNFTKFKISLNQFSYGFHCRSLVRSTAMAIPAIPPMRGGQDELCIETYRYVNVHVI